MSPRAVLTVIVVILASSTAMTTATVDCGGSTQQQTEVLADGPRGANGAIVEDGGTLTADAGRGVGPAGGSQKLLPCGTATCRLPAESCCLSNNENGTFTFACVVGPSCPAAANGGNAPAALGCTTTTNCAEGSVCCITQQSENSNNSNDDDQGNSNGNNDDRTRSTCKPSCGEQEAQLCDPAAGTGCPSGVACTNVKAESWELPPTFGTCGGKGP